MKIRLFTTRRGTWELLASIGRATFYLSICRRPHPVQADHLNGYFGYKAPGAVWPTSTRETR